MKKIAFVFPGQASQYVGMARDFYEEFGQIKDMFNRASEVLGFDLADVCFNGPEGKLTQTAFTQPAVFTHSCAIDSMLKEYGLMPDAVAGHSLGEYSALVSAGALDFETALKAIAVRSKAMQEDCDNNPGTMAAILGMDPESIKSVLSKIDGIVVPANINSPGQIVIAGEIDVVNRACELLKDAGAKRAMTIPVGGAYHSPLMKKSSDIMSKFIEKNVDFSEFRCPVYPNVSAEAISSATDYGPLLQKQILNPVLWQQTLENMQRDGIGTFIEIGPGKVLQGLVKKTLKDFDIEFSGIDSLEQFDTYLEERAVSA